FMHGDFAIGVIDSLDRVDHPVAMIANATGKISGKRREQPWRVDWLGPSNLTELALQAGERTLDVGPDRFHCLGIPRAFGELFLPPPRCGNTGTAHPLQPGPQLGPDLGVAAPIRRLSRAPQLSPHLRRDPQDVLMRTQPTSQRAQCYTE